MTAKEALEKADFFSAASAGSRDEIAGFAYIRRYGKGARVFYDREESTCLYFLVEGVASLYKINSLGEKKVIFVYGPGNLLNEDSLLRLTSAVNCEVREDSLVMVLPAELFKLGKDYGVCSGDGTLIEMNSSILLRPKQALR